MESTKRYGCGPGAWPSEVECLLILLSTSRFGLSPDDYTAAQLRYDLMKLRAKGLIRKLDGMTRYVITPKGMVQGTAIMKLTECLNGTLGESDTGSPKVASNGASKGLSSCSIGARTLLNHVGLRAA
jgi:hypothetical protein